MEFVIRDRGVNLQWGVLLNTILCFRCYLAVVGTYGKVVIINGSEASLRAHGIELIGRELAASFLMMLLSPLLTREILCK